jgi:hypothetical protein
VIVIDKLLRGGIGWVLQRLADAADAEQTDESSLREELLGAQMRLELGEIDEAEFEAVEESVIRRMREARQRDATPETAGEGMRYAVEAIEADAGDESDAAAAPSSPARSKKPFAGQRPRKPARPRPPRSKRPRGKRPAKR